MSRDITFGDRQYRLAALKCDRDWIAHAVRTDSGDRFGIECVGADQDMALDRLAAWLSWQHEHTDALEALQQSERAYHRMVAASAFAIPSEGPTAVEEQRESLDALERARTRLDEVRSRKPE